MKKKEYIINMIPRIIHFCWLTGALTENARKCIDSWKRHHKEYDIRIWTIPGLLNIQWLSEETRKFLENPSIHYVNKSDVARWIPLLQEGGIYADTDVRNNRCIEGLLNTTSFAGVSYDPCYIGNAVLGCEPHNDLFRKILNLTVEKTLANLGDALMFPEYYGVILHSNYLIDVETLYPQKYFYPFSWCEMHKKNNKFLKSYCVHLWNGMEKGGWSNERMEKIKNKTIKLTRGLV
jgi:hypothetical protein